jgi:hypothetical protein
MPNAPDLIDYQNTGRLHGISMPATKDHASDSKGPLPLVFAVTGHRDLRKQDEELLRQRVQEIFSELNETYPSTPLRLLSGLAEGADRLVAKIALNNDIELVACLPMERSSYEADFQATESRQEFQQLLACSSQVISLPLVDGNTAKMMQEQGPARDKQYRRLGEFLVEHCQILIALWDGTDSDLVGGTSSVVRLQLGENCTCDTSSMSPLDFPETGPVYHILTPRTKNTNTAGKLFERHDKYHEGFENEEAAKKAYAGLFQRMNLFNRDAVTYRAKLETAIIQSQEWLIPSPVRARLPRELQKFIEYYGLADALAIYFRKWTHWLMGGLIFGCGLIGLLLFTIFAHGPSMLQPITFWLYLGILALAFIIYRYANSGKLKTRYVDYRALAEGLRVQTFWTLAGIKHTVANHYLRKQKSELDWIRSAIRAWALKLQSMSVRPDLPLVQKHWVDDQARFFQKRARQDFKHYRRERALTGVCIVALAFVAFIWGCIMALSVVGVISGLTPQSLGAKLLFLPGMEINGAVAIIMTMLPGIAGAIAAFSVKMAFSEQRKQYARMRDLYSRGSLCLAEALSKGDQQLAQRIVLDLGKEALEENGDWVLLHREREFEIRLGG